tara:strand:+ start:738 stop:2138 length:1401 start_codon:yes stop_codon:yes gene_type:complete
MNYKGQFLNPLWLSFILFLSLYGQSVQAFKEQGKQAYSQEYQVKAFNIYQRRAHFGDVDAQLKLVSCYAQGVGVEADMTMSVLYLKLAEGHGSKIAKDKIASFTAKQKTAIQTLWHESAIQKKYGYDVLVKNILPELLEKEFKLRPPRQMSKTESVSRSMFAPRRNLLTSLIINYDVGHDGRARDIEIDNNIGMDHIALKGALEQEALKQYRPANKLKNKKLKVRSFGHRNVWAQRSINENAIKDRLPRFYKKVKKLRVNADKGNANAQYQLAMLILAFPALEINTMSYIKYIEMAAKAGIPEAEAEFAQLLLTGKKIKKDLDQGISYLLSAAQSGYARAQYKLARQFLSGRIIEKNEHKAQFWLEQSETQDEMYAKFWLARLSLTSEDQALRNPELAKQLLANVARQERNNPNWYYFSALAQLQLGDKKQGRSLLTDGIELAEEYSWDLSEFEQLSEQLKVKSDV